MMQFPAPVEALAGHNAQRPARRLLGLDVAKAEIVAHDRAADRTFKIKNTPAALREALLAYADYDLAVCETTGGYENALVSVCLEIGLPIHRAHAARIKAFIASYGARAKTDAIDAAWIAAYGEERFAKLRPFRAPEQPREDLAALMRLRHTTLRQRTAVKNQRSSPSCGPCAGFLDAQIAFLTAQVAALDAEIAKRIKADSQVRADEAALRATPGIGPVSARSLLAFMPELGALSKKQAASLAGLAPHPKDSGQVRGRRTTGAGRQGLKEPLFMAAMRAVKDCPVLKAFYERLCAAGKPKRLALTAVARKLIVRANAILKHRRNAENQPLETSTPPMQALT